MLIARPAYDVVTRGPTTLTPYHIRDMHGLASSVRRQLEDQLRTAAFNYDVDRVLDLTPRELEILDLVARGLSNVGIAAAIGVSPHTVRNHLHSVYAKLGVTSRMEAVALLLSA